ncbi:hypothetical protein ESY86_10365 [Subsaximicrobium wynnwilliamsii]|uniref:Uncharacterized protein n=1 Tax=Subsaximicrobium wynnwilliamsii TaxID=291179 RepID=A0A5C6ZI94_9FLAO|nr:hypothetical protein ESY87_06475 [Subsaximicrobium wynnwilliamsii]TXD89006.1 hypothetical protein ESY86_10365 [Subsaximicrobium wynnwilliamsii]TXE04011.1 hypothetical protein ESY88_06470 [Subsaximicrobium wynnwilliamsii]
MVIGSLIGVLIALTPFLFYSYIYIPEESHWDAFLFTYHSGFYNNARTGMWSILGKFVPLFLLFIWFFTCRHWWFHAILVPISMFTYQIIGVINDDIIFFDNFDLIYMVPIMAVIIPSIYLIRAKMFDKINNADKSMKEIEEEFMIKPKGLMNTLKQYF